MASTSAMQLVLEYAGSTDVGLRRSNNEDAWWAGPLSAPADQPLVDASGRVPFRDGIWLGVSDGLGGANAGEIASRIAVAETQGAIAAAPRGELLEATAREALGQANRAVLAASRSNPDWAGMGATLSCVWIERHGALIGQVGDSRVYRLRKSSLEELSIDHSPVGRLRQAGRLSETDARLHPSRHVIDQCLGGGDPGLVPDCVGLELQKEDILLLCTDGLTDGVRDSELAVVLGAVQRGEITLEQSVEELITRANQLSGRDNVTVIVARCTAE